MYKNKLTKCKKQDTISNNKSSCYGKKKATLKNRNKKGGREEILANEVSVQR